MITNSRLGGWILCGMFFVAAAKSSCCWSQEPNSVVAGTSDSTVLRQLKSNPDLERLLTPLLKAHQVPGLAAGIVKGDRLTAAAAVGVRKSGAQNPLTLDDKLHLGSNTKAMTATLIALLVEEGKLSWNSTLGEVFSNFQGAIHADFRPVTLEQLLQHRGGLKPNGDYGKVGNGSATEQREALARQVLAAPPSHPPGTKFEYSNLGYILAGHMAEIVTGRSWEELMTKRLFEPLKMPSAGFGPPGTTGEIDQPWGHALNLGIVRQALQHDNPAVLGPAGTVHCSLDDWSRFVVLHLQGARGGGQLLKPESFNFLHTPSKGADYAGGWIIVDRPWAKGRTLAHHGSNTMWFASVWIAPKTDTAFLAVTNQGGAAGQKACDAAITELIKWQNGQEAVSR